MMNKELKAKINAIVRDATKTVPMSKSELRERIVDIAVAGYVQGYEESQEGRSALKYLTPAKAE